MADQLLVEAARLEKERREQLLRWENDLVAFFMEAWKIEIPGEIGPQKPEAREAQIEALRAFHSERYLVCLKARQIGWTTLASAFSCWCALFGDSRRIILLSKGQRESSQLKRRVSYGYRNLPQWARERLPALTKNTTLEMRFANDSSIEAMPSKADPARGESAFLIIVDEWAFLENPAEAWASIEPATDVGGRCIGISTAKGYGSWFHEFYTKARTGNSKFKAMFFSWRAVPSRDQEWLEGKIQNMSDRSLRAQEYADDDVTCWMKQGDAYFDPSTLPAPEDMSDPLAVCDVRLGEGGSPILFMTNDGALALYRPRSEAARYVVGADVAEGLEGGDWSVAQVLDRASNEQVAVFRARVKPDVFGSYLVLLAKYFNGAYLGVERNNSGLATITSIQNLGYTNIFYDRPLVNQRGHRPRPRMPGWHTTEASKALLMSQLAGALRDDLVLLNDAQTVRELWGMQAKESGNKTFFEGKPHDDCVIALGIAYQMLRFASGKAYADAADETEDASAGMTFDDFARLTARTQAKAYVSSGRWK